METRPVTDSVSRLGIQAAAVVLPVKPKFAGELYACLLYTSVFLVFKGVFLLVHVVPPEMKAPPRRVSGTGVRFLTHGSTLSLTLSTL